MLMIPKTFPETQDTLFHKNFAEKTLCREDLLAFNTSLCDVSELARWSGGWLDKTPTERLFQEVAQLSIKHLKTKYTANSQVKCYLNADNLYREIKNPSMESKRFYNKINKAINKFFSHDIQ